MGIGAVRAALIVAAALAVFHAMPAASKPPRAHGREMVAQYQLPADAVARYALRDVASSEPADSFADTAWLGPLQAAGAGRNPYTLVLSVNGVAKASGEVRTQWQAGWEVRESPLATREVLMTLGSVSERAVAAGAPVALTVVGAPLTFRGERQVAPLLHLVSARNLDISDVQVQVWSGSAPLLAWPAASAPRPALLGVGGLCLLLWFLLRGGARPAAAPAALPSRLPRPDLPRVLEQPASAEMAAPTPAAPPPAPAPNQASRVVAALRDVLTHGLAVPTELDDRRRSHHRRQA